MEALGFVSFWGFTPAVNFFQGTTISLEEDRELNILLSECSDLRHLMKSLAESLPLKEKRSQPLNIYIHERQKENICRDLLFLTLMCETQLAERER